MDAWSKIPTNLFEFKPTAKMHRHHFHRGSLKVINAYVCRCRKVLHNGKQWLFRDLAKDASISGDSLPSTDPFLSYYAHYQPASKSENYRDANWTESLSVPENISVLIELHWWDLNKPGTSGTQFTMVLFNHKQCMASKSWVKHWWETDRCMKDCMEVLC